MKNSDFEGPPLGWSVFSIVGGVVTAIALIFGLELSADRLSASDDSSPTAIPTASTLTDP